MQRQANVAQLVEQLIRNEQVTGSSPVIGSHPPHWLLHQAALLLWFMMHTSRILPVLFFAVSVLWSCTRQTDFGEDITVSNQPLTVSQARSLPNRGKTVVVRGVITEVCQDEGCWFALVDDRAEITTRFKLDGIGIPVISRGTVLVKGVVRDTVIGNSYVPELHARGVKFVN